MFTMLTCPKCHRMFESPTAECVVKAGGCGYVVPQTTPTEPVTEAELEQASEAAAIEPEHVQTVAEASEAATAAINALNIQHG